jgi:hypothetical protein
VYLCSGIDERSKYETPGYFTEHTTWSNNLENRLSHHTVISDEDQMDQYYLMVLPEQYESKESGLSALLFLNNFSYSVWQPPKIF